MKFRTWRGKGVHIHGRSHQKAGVRPAPDGPLRHGLRPASLNWGHDTGFRIVRTGGFPRGESANSEIGIVSPILL